MTEVLTTPHVPSAADLEAVVEARNNTKTKFFTFAGLGALSLAAWYAENRGYLNGLPPPAFSLRHPVLGYGGGWVASRILGKSKSAVIAGGATVNFMGETAQGQIFDDGRPLGWADVTDGTRSESNLDNAADLATAMGGAALLLIQTGGLDWARVQASRLRSGFSSFEAPAASSAD